MSSFQIISHLKILIKRLFGQFGYSIVRTKTLENADKPELPADEYISYPFWVPPGHFYSPYPDLEEVKRDAERIFNPNIEILDIDLRLEQQRDWLKRFATLYPTMPEFPEEKNRNFRYYYNNSNYGSGDAVTLNCMLRLIKPQKVIEIGSGYSSAVILDTVDHNLEHQLQLTCIDPYPERLFGLLKSADRELIKIIPTRVQEVDPALFSKLDKSDILFVDSTHISKVGSDVNFILFEIFPRLNPGVYIHIHDIFYPFEYPQVWIYEGRVWHENYLVRALLQNNNCYQIEFFFDMLRQLERRYMEENLPLSLKVPGDNLWLRKTRPGLIIP